MHRLCSSPSAVGSTLQRLNIRSDTSGDRGFQIKPCQLRKRFEVLSLDSETRIVVQQRTTEIHSLVRRTAQDVIEIEQKLIEVKQRLPHGGFGDWLETEFEWTTRTAQSFMSVAEKFSKYENFSHLNFAPSALYLLASPSTPEEVRQEAIVLAQRLKPLFSR